MFLNWLLKNIWQKSAGKTRSASYIEGIRETSTDVFERQEYRKLMEAEGYTYLKATKPDKEFEGMLSIRDVYADDENNIIEREDLKRIARNKALDQSHTLAAGLRK